MNTPLFLKNFIIHSNIASNLFALKSDINHTIFYGSRSTGKKTLIYALINSIHDDNTTIQKYRTIKFNDITVNGNSIPIQYVQSPYHFEFNLSEFGLCDRDVIVEYIKKIIEYKTIDNKFRIILLHHFDRLSKDTQNTLFSLMDNYMSTSRFFFICNNIKSLHPNFISRVNTIRIPFPSVESISTSIRQVLPNISDNDINNIINKSNYNLFNINHLIFFIKQSNSSIDEILLIPSSKYSINQLIPHIISHDISSIKIIRPMLYDFILANISIVDIFNEITFFILNHNNLSNEVKQLFLQDITPLSSNISFIEYNIIIIELLIFKVKKLLLIHNV
jgi:hypothetical protein